MIPFQPIARIALGCALAVSAVAHAHVVPPEDFHPTAESYRRAVFMLNLNPVLWDEVRRDVDTIARHYADVEQHEGGSYASAVTAILDAVAAEASISVPSPEFRKQSARQVFELSTIAVAEMVRLHLEAAREHLNDYERARTAFDAARQISAAFEHEIQATDPQGFHTLGQAWLECSSALGHPGVAGVGAVLPDSEVFFTASRDIVDYIADNFGPGYSAQGSGRLVALPVNSDTFDADAAVPAKLPPGHNINKQLPRPRQVLNMAERGVDESETTLIALGDMAFDSPYIFGEPAQSLQLSCNTCHNKSITNPQFFVPGLSARPGGLDVSNSFFAPHANNGHFDAIDIPDLRGIRFTAPYGRNGRFASLREFVRNVIVHEFNGPEPDPILMDAIIAYMNEFDFLPNPNIEPNGMLTEHASDSAKRGEKLFNRPFPQMNNMSCATCHVPSNHFMDGKRHDIGSVNSSSEYARDGALDTPTLLSSVYTAPYFHDGSLPTLESVVEWFNEEYTLDLADEEIADLTAYLKAIGDGEEGYEDTIHTLEAELEEFSFFLSSYEYVRRIDKPDIMNAIFQTIAAEIQAHKWDVQDQSQLPVLNRMAALMDEAYAAGQAGNYDAVDSIVTEYRRVYDEHADVLK